MSDKQDTDTEDTDPEDKGSEDSRGDAPAVAQPAAPAPQATAKTEKTKSSSGIAWLALLLVLALGAGAGWLVPQLQQGGADLEARLSRLESDAGRDTNDLQSLGAELRGEMNAKLGDLESEVAANSAQFSQAIVAVEAQLAEQRAELSRFTANDRSSWLMAEAEYLLRLANQRLIMAGDTVAARALLTSADSVLREIDDVGLHTVRGAVASDLAAVRAVPVIDVEGIYLRLAALIEQADSLTIFTIPDIEESERPEAAEDWQGRLRQGYEDALLKLSDYIVIRRRDVPMQALMDPQFEGLVRQNLRMLLEQAQVALLSGNQALYSESLDRALHWLLQFRDTDAATAGAMWKEIERLATTRIGVDMPDISNSLRALDAAMEARLDDREGGAG